MTQTASPATRPEVHCFDVVIYQGHEYLVVQLHDTRNGRRASLKGHCFTVPVGELSRPGEAPAPTPAPAFTVAGPRATMPPAPTARRTRRKLTPVVRSMRTTLLVSKPGTPYRSECWGAISKDGVWRYVREDEPTTPWYVVHVATGETHRAPFRTLNDARAYTANRVAVEDATPIA